MKNGDEPSESAINPDSCGSRLEEKKRGSALALHASIETEAAR